MHTAGKVLLILGGLITALGVFFIILGGSMSSFDLENESVASGYSGTFSAGDSGFGFSVWVSENTECLDVDISVTYNDKEKFNPDCIWNDPQQDDGVEGFYKIGQVGLLDDDGGMYVFSSSHQVYFVDSGAEVGEAVGGLASFMSGLFILCCGGFLLVLGLILGLTIKTADPVMVYNGQMNNQMMVGQMPMQQMPMQQMPMQQMPAQTTAQPYEYEQK